MLKQRLVVCWGGFLHWAWVGLDDLKRPLKPFPFLIPGLSRQERGPGLCWGAELFCTPTLSRELQIKILPKMAPLPPAAMVPAAESAGEGGGGWWNVLKAARGSVEEGPRLTAKGLFPFLAQGMGWGATGGLCQPLALLAQDSPAPQRGPYLKQPNSGAPGSPGRGVTLGGRP